MKYDQAYDFCPFNCNGMELLTGCILSKSPFHKNLKLQLQQTDAVGADLPLTGRFRAKVHNIIRRLTGKHKRHLPLLNIQLT